MEILSYESKELLPGILLNKQSGIFQIYGQSCPENAFEFYEPIFDWFDKYAENPLKSTTMDFKMTYFNTTSTKFLLMLMNKLEDLSDSGKDIKIRWFYTDGNEDLREAGEEFMNIIDLKFECIPVENETDEFEADIIDFAGDIL